jgi:RNA recognition motif-containing protein
VRRDNNRSKGFGFIEFETEKDQQAALEKMNKHQVKGRELILRIAYIDNPPQSGASTTAASDSAAPAAAPAASS